MPVLPLSIGHLGPGLAWDACETEPYFSWLSRCRHPETTLSLLFLASPSPLLYILSGCRFPVSQASVFRRALFRQCFPSSVFLFISAHTFFFCRHCSARLARSPYLLISFRPSFVFFLALFCFHNCSFHRSAPHRDHPSSQQRRHSTLPHEEANVNATRCCGECSSGKLPHMACY